ncbi:hypothetical protein KL86DYS1_30951 [uncultured Dysgonomonas sp.]|uniref:Uncharacterized protein n=1 Tax=uncultured Dysgonomonas sp. TaxID=206096 RepID=A0A212JZF9_9BACT|nr:hypothetical protein KL86DYS1_30951 [uncultured Dysgonomonas sp.]
MSLRRGWYSLTLCYGKNLRNKNNEKIYYLFRLSVGDIVEL